MIVNDLCLGRIKCEDPNQRFNAIKKSIGTDIVAGMKYRLNKNQIEQIQKALGQTISMIQGPPGICFQILLLNSLKFYFY